MEPGSSSGGSSARGVVSDQGREEKQKEMREKLSEVCGVGEEEEEEDDDKSNGIASGFVPGPLVSLKEQIDKDKVLFVLLSPPQFYFSLFIYVDLSLFYFFLVNDSFV